MEQQKFPDWAEKVRRRYIGGESSLFILHGNVVDYTLYDDQYYSLTDFLVRVLLIENKQLVLYYDAAEGIKMLKNEGQQLSSFSDQNIREPKVALPMLEEVLQSNNSTAVIINYAETLVPAGELSFLDGQDRINLVTLHRWSLNQNIATKDNVVFLVSESLTEINAKLVTNPRISTVAIPLPDREQRYAAVRKSDPNFDEKQASIFARHTAGLKTIQISGLLTPQKSDELDDPERQVFIQSLLGAAKHSEIRAKKLAALTKGMDRREIKQLLGSDHETETVSEATDLEDYSEVINLVNQRKKEIIEKECSGLIEFLDPKHDLSAVGGCDHITDDLMVLAQNIRDGNKTSVPMGLLFVGPMGSGKTFVANAFIKESGISGVRLKNFRSKWVGSTEANLEKVFDIVKSLGPLFLVIDEGDRAFGSSGESDGGTSSRVIGRIKEFMSDPDNRGNVVFILMTNRPDKLDVDIKRAGRLDRKIPFFYAAEATIVEQVLDALLRRYGGNHNLAWPRNRYEVSSKLVGYSNADLEAVVLLAVSIARQTQAELTVEHMVTAIDDYMPPRDTDMLEYMELLAVFETSRRSLLPAKYRDIAPDELNEKLREKRLQLRL
ncbi:MAG: AAA family ATPase [Methylococcales bacterium]